MRVWFSSVTTNRSGLFRASILLAGIASGLLSLNAASQPPTLSSGNSPFAEPRFLPVDEAFSFYVSIGGASIDSSTSLRINWQVVDGYYLYQDKFRFSWRKNRGENEKLQILSHDIPPGVAHNDEFFGDVNVYYQDTAAVISLPADIDKTFTLVVEFQGCSTQGLCYPPQSRDLEILL